MPSGGRPPSIASAAVAVGTRIAARPPRRSRRAAFPHRAPVLGDTIAPFGVWGTHAVAQQDRAGAGDTPVRCCARGMPCRPVSPRPGRLPSIPSAADRSALFEDFISTMHPVRLLRRVHHRLRPLRPSRCGPARRYAARPSRRSPRFRRKPFLRDAVFDHGRATAPRITVPHMLPSTLLTVSASATFELSRLNSAPHRIAVYASCPPSPTTTQHSLAQLPHFSDQDPDISATWRIFSHSAANRSS
jgi:hypothetical protein